MAGLELRLGLTNRLGFTPGQGGGTPVTPLGPLVGTYMAGAAPGYQIFQISGLMPGEAVTGVTPNDLFAVTSDGKLLVGLTPTTTTADRLPVITTSLGRALIPTLTVVPKLTISGTPGQATVGSAYTFTPVIVGGFAPYTVAASNLLTGTQVTSQSTSAPQVTGTPTDAQSLTGVTLTVTDSKGNSVTSAAISFTSVFASTLTTEPVGRQTRSGVKVAQLPAGSVIASGTNSGHFAVDGAGAVTVSAAGQTAGLQTPDYVLAITGGTVTTLDIPTEANTFDVTTGAQSTAAETAALAAGPTVDWKIRVRNGSVITDSLTMSKVLSGAISDPNTGIQPTLAGQLALNRGVNIASVSGGSITFGPRTQYGAKLAVAPTFQGCGPYLVENFDFTKTATADNYNAKFNSVTQPFLWKPEVSISKTSAVTISVASPAVVTWTAHGLKPNYPVVFSNSGGALPTGITAGTTYYVDTVTDANNFTLRTTPPGGTGTAVAATAAGTGTQTATTTAGGVIGVGTITQNGVGYLASTNVRKIYITYKASGAGSGFNGWFDANDDGTIDATSPLTVTATGTLYDSTTNFRAPTVSEGVQISTQQTDISTATVPQCTISVNGTVKANMIFRGNRWGTQAGNVNRYNTCVWARQFGKLIFENNVCDGFYAGLQCFAGDELDIRNNEVKNYVNDGVDFYPSATVLAGQTQMLSRFHDNLFYMLNDTSVDWSNSHSDPLQIGSGGDLLDHATLDVYNFMYTPSDVTKLTGQGFQNGDTTKNIRARIANNFWTGSTTNMAIMWRCDPANPSIAVNNTGIRQRRADDTAIGTSAIPATIRPAAAGGYRITGNVIGEVWDQVSGAHFNTDPVGGSRVGGGTIGTYYSDNNGYVNEQTPNTGNGDSFPEVFAGGPSAFVWMGPVIGWQIAPGVIRTDTAAHCKADITSIFAIAPGAAAKYQGKGFLAAPTV